MMQAADAGNGDHLAALGWFDLARRRRVLFQTLVGPRLVVVDEVIRAMLWQTTRCSRQYTMLQSSLAACRSGSRMGTNDALFRLCDVDLRLRAVGSLPGLGEGGANVSLLHAILAERERVLVVPPRNRAYRFSSQSISRIPFFPERK